MRAKITQTMVKNLAASKVEIWWDTETRGFGIKFNPTTRHKGFIAKRGNAVRAVGPADTMTVEQAREEAKEILRELRKGIDRKAIAKAEKKAAEEQRERDMTFGYVLTDYCRRGRVKASSADYYTTMAKRQCADWWDRPLRSITGKMVLDKYEAVIERVKDGGAGTGIGTANMVKRIVSRTWNHGIALGIEGLGLNPVKVLDGDHRLRLDPRTDHVPLDRLKDFHDALAKLPVWAVKPLDDYPPADVLRLILYTGLRKGNARSLRWDQIDFERKVIRIDATEMKGKKRLDLPMNTLVEGLLKRRQERRRFYPGCGWVFPSYWDARQADRDGSYLPHVRDIKQPLVDALKLAGIGHVTVHGLRRTHATACYEAGLSIEQTGMLLSHAKPSGVTAGYIQNLESRMPAFVAIVGNYLAKAFGLAPSNVVALTRPAEEINPAPVIDQPAAASM